MWQRSNPDTSSWLCPSTDFQSSNNLKHKSIENLLQTRNAKDNQDCIIVGWVYTSDWHCDMSACCTVQVSLMQTETRSCIGDQNSLQLSGGAEMHPCLLKIKARTRCDYQKMQAHFLRTSKQACPGVPVATIVKVGYPPSLTATAQRIRFWTIGLMLFDRGHAFAWWTFYGVVPFLNYQPPNFIHIRAVERLIF